MSRPTTTDLHDYIEVQQSSRRFFMTKIAAMKLVSISYASVRRQSSEEGAVQRILNPRRIAGLKSFALGGGDYPASFVLNWVSDTNPLRTEKGRLFIPSAERSAQIIDGQHRIAGLREALKEDPAVGTIEIPVSIYDHLDTPGCATIFLSINTEQRPVPPSLVLDLYGVTDEHGGDAAAMRAKDIAMMLHETEGSPYEALIKLPGAPRSHGGIALSTVVTAIKPLVADKGTLEQYGVGELEMQFKAILNFLASLQSKYGDSWYNLKENAFLFAAGFAGAMDFFRTRMVPYCGKESDFQQQFMAAALRIERKAFIRPADTSGLSGKAAASRVAELLTERFSPRAVPASAIKI
ncbi:MAG: DGQHR domain-containing protein [Polyangiaceae bacterium]|nr:DGQHR domain-containing protein [Polyangiaceae bacterium]